MNVEITQTSGILIGITQTSGLLLTIDPFTPASSSAITIDRTDITIDDTTITIDSE